ncbi:MAG: C39 family peptidase [Verrucomicrobiota bacterium]
MKKPFNAIFTHDAAVLAGVIWILIGPGLQAQEKPANADDPKARANAFVEQLRTGKLACPLDLLVDIPKVWSLTPDQLHAAFAVPKGVEMKKSPYFEWMTNDRTRAVFMRHPYTDLQVELALFGGEIPVEEVVVDFLDGKLNGITFSLYNRGDSGEISAADFQTRFKLCGKKMSGLLQVKPNARKANPTEGLLSEGWIWVSQKGMATLEHNPEANAGEVEFLRLKIAPRDAKGTMAAAFQGRSSAVKLSDLPRNLTKTPNGDVFIKGLPMVDQGPKGYCVVASAQRLFEYYGIPADQHQIAQVAGTDAKTGTSALAMAEALGKIDFRFKTRFKILCMATSHELVEVDERKMTVGKPVAKEQFSKEIHHYIDEGIPLLWGLMLGLPEEPSIAQQAGGSHMRMIIGYNDKTGDILFSDSWGAGHELKRMTLSNAYKSTHGLFAMFPTVR